MKISVFMIVHNAERSIERALRSVSWAREIVIVDSRSSDRTVEICRRYTDRIYQKEFTDFSDMKNFALSRTEGDWALSLDADEEVTEGLKTAIGRAVSSGGGGMAAFRVKRRSRIFGRWFRFCGTQDDFPVRLFRRGAASFVQPVHETVSVSGVTGVIKEPMLHYTYDSLSEYIDRLNRYTTMEEAFLRSKGEDAGLIRLCMKPLLRFVHLYIIKQGFRDGPEGFAFAALSGFYDFVKYAKLRMGRNS